MDKYYDRLLELANISFVNNDVPVGAIIIKDNKIISEGYNTREKEQNLLGHAEINAIQNACKSLNNWNLQGCIMLVSLKPCSMCMEVIKQCRIDKVYYLLEKPMNKHEYSATKFELIDCQKFAQKYNNILSKFFVNLREKK